MIEGPDKGPFVLYSMMRILRNRGDANRKSGIVKMMKDTGMHRINVWSIGIEF